MPWPWCRSARFSLVQQNGYPGGAGCIRGSSPRHSNREIEELARIPPFVVVPSHHLHEGRVELNSRSHVEHGRTRFAAHVARYDLLVRVAEHPFEGSFGGAFHRRTDAVVARLTDKLAREIDDGNVRYRDAKGHPGEPPLQRREH